MRTLWSLGLVLAMAWVAPTTAADTVGAGASGQCYDREGNGGQDEVRVVVNTDGPPNPSVTLLSGTGAAAALAEFAAGAVESGGAGGCSNADTLDYVEADANVGAASAQVCYDGTARVDGACPRSPPGPGAPG